MERTAMGELLAWKERGHRKPLLMFGARQVGKSYLLEQFAKENYENYALLNLESDPRIAQAFEGSLEPRNVISNLGQVLGWPLDVKGMLYVFDEVQTELLWRSSISKRAVSLILSSRREAFWGLPLTRRITPCPWVRSKP